MEWLCRDLDAFSREELEKALENLTPSRKAHILRMRRPEDADRSLAGEILAQTLLRQRCGVENAQIHRDDAGKPYLTGCDLHISIAHSHRKIACAVSETPVGIDIERIRPVKRQLLSHVCVEEEMRYVLGTHNEDLLEDIEVLRRFFEVWTAKEAYFKKQGTGITNLKAVNVLHLPRQMYTVEDYILQII